MKKCRRCEVEKPWTEFRKSTLTKDGYEKDCKACKIALAAAFRASHPDVLTKVCHGCKVEKPVGEFYASKTSRDGYQAECRECRKAREKKRWAGLSEEEKKQNNARSQQWRDANPEASKRISQNSVRKYNYGLDAEAFQKMLEEQNYRCAICGQKETCLYRGEIRQLSVDHNHSNGEIRSLLCYKCNHGLGDFKDDLRLLEAAAAYLRRHGGV